MSEQAPARPAPIADEASQPFFDAAAQGKLLIKHCDACNRYLAPQAELCDACFTTELDWKEASGKGTIYSFIVNHQVSHPGFAGVVPYNIIVVETDEGPRLNSNYVGANEELKVDMPVKVAFEQVGDVAVPKWTAAQ
jgi:uncharacterized OB-fold protein